MIREHSLRGGRQNEEKERDSLIMSHARLRKAVVAGGWPTKTMTMSTMTTRQGAGGALLARREGMADGGPVSSALLQQTITPCRGMAANAAAGPCSKVLTEDNVFVNLRKMEYAVRGPLLIRALELEKELQKVRLLSEVRNRKSEHACVGRFITL